jgi:hypothetical protein
MNSSDEHILTLIRQSMGIELQENLSLDELRKILSDHINPLISNNFNKLISILYRLDINESKLKQLLYDNPAGDAGMIIADLIIERQVQKAKTRELFRKKDTNISEDEEW